MTTATLRRVVPGLEGKTPIELRDASKRYGVHHSSIRRWILRGCRGIRLAGYRHGGRLYTTTEDLEVFQQQLAATLEPAAKR